MTFSWSSFGVPFRMPESMNHFARRPMPPMTGTSKKVTFPFVAELAADVLRPLLDVETGVVGEAHHHEG